MPIYLAVDSSLSMRSLPDEGYDKTCWQVACELSAKLVERLTAFGISDLIKLVDFSHNSSILLHKTQSPKEVEKALSGVEVSASADLLSLFSLMKMESADERSTLVVITDTRAFTPEEMKYSHIPECRVNFVCVLDEMLVDEEQLTRFVIIAALSDGVDVTKSPDTALSYMPLFVSEFADMDKFSAAVAAQICPPPEFTLHCGMLSSPIELSPMKHDNEWDTAIEIIGFIKSIHLAYAPLAQHHYITERCERNVGEGEDTSDGFLIALCDALAAEEMSAICHLNEQTYGVIRSVKSQGSDDRMLIMSSFPRGLSSIYWLPHLERLLPQAVVEGNNEGTQLCAANDSLAKPSYARTPLTCWLDAQGIQADFQKVIRLLRKIPDRTVAFYSEINRMHQHACAIGAEDILKKLTDLIEEESQLHSPIIKNHGTYVCEILRKRGVKDSTPLIALQ
uniref:Integrator complex subunit 14 n=1 Tax=Parascaris univalens TaxID=6257 RepID=A0A915CHD4_PARUN